MKLIVSILLTALMAFTIGLFPFPWYAYTFTTFIIFAAIPQKSFKSFLAGFFAVALLYLVLAITIDISNEHLLSKKVAEIFKLKDNYWILILLTVILNGLVAGFAALSGSMFRKVLSSYLPKKED